RELFAYLRSLARGQPQYEAKVLLVGEGNVGKTSLVAALQGKPFVENRPTTHGIQLGMLPVRHPALDVDLTLNTWDFGGQEVYRITHQFFFSRRALYLLVWRPREGQEENAIEAWCQRIQLRIGDDARIMIVATHCDERSPELDYPGLKRKFGDLLVGHYAVDNHSGTGIEALRQAIATQAARLPQMGELISDRWVAVRDELAARAQPQIAFREFVAVCAQHELDGEATHALASLLHDLGHVVYYGDDDGLRDLVVLQPEWLTKAIGYVLEDTVTRQAGGVLAHARLSNLWEHRPGSESYPAACHPYFLRLMEKFDVSYRLPEEEQASLVGQLVPYERPTLPWDDDHEAYGTRTLSLVCHTSKPPPGLVAWLTVRNHRFSARPSGLHWRRGVFLAHPAYASEALFELTDDMHLALTVRAPSPDYLFSVLRDSVEDLIARRWPGLTYELLVPCLATFGDGTRCRGQFRLRSLQTFREQAKPTIDCHECAQPQDVARLLTGFSMPSSPLRPQLDEMRERVEKMAERVEGRAADIANEIRAVLKVVSTEVTDCPALFTVAPVSAQDVRRLRVWQTQYRLTLWCAHPGAWHPWPQAAYDLKRPKDWLASIAPYAVLVSKTLRLVVPIAGAVAGVVWSEEQQKSVKDEIELMTTVVDKLPEHGEARQPTIDSGIDSEHRLTQAEGAGLRSLRTLLLEQDPSRSFGGLRRVRTASGDFLWICADHYLEYDPGLPTLPQ
ncbi:MAG: COR domain-containing protein, partial [Egibacteraceae bacterium]